MAPSIASDPGLRNTKTGIPTSTADTPAGLELVPSDKLDPRSDHEIASYLQARHPITSDKNIWAFWHTGYTSMPPWVQRNIINWVRRLGLSWTVHVLDHVSDSPTNILHYVDESYFPAAFLNHTMDGPYVGQHSGDLIRLPLLWLYGGIWIDAGTMLFRHVDDICWNTIIDPSTPYEMAGFVIELRPGIPMMLNGFIATKRGNKLVKMWHDIYLTLWTSDQNEGCGTTNAHGFHKHPLVSHLPLMEPPMDKLGGPELASAKEDFTDYLGHFMCFERLRKVIDVEEGFNGPEYYKNNMFLIDAVQHLYNFMVVTGFSGTKQFQIMSTKRSGEGAVKDEKWFEANKIVNDALTNTAAMKLSHGPQGALESLLADMWDSEDHAHKDVEEGSFAAYLRYGSVHYEQTKEIAPVRLPEMDEEIIHIGYLQPKQH